MHAECFTTLDNVKDQCYLQIMTNKEKAVAIRRMCRAISLAGRIMRDFVEAVLVNVESVTARSVAEHGDQVELQIKMKRGDLTLRLLASNVLMTGAIAIEHTEGDIERGADTLGPGVEPIASTSSPASWRHTCSECEALDQAAAEEEAFGEALRQDNP